MNFSTTCLRYSKFISLESFKSELLVTVTEALGTSEFARSSGTSLSGLIFYKKKKTNPQRKKRSTLQTLSAWHWEGSGFRISKEGCIHNWVQTGHQQLLILHGITAEKCLQLSLHCRTGAGWCQCSVHISQTSMELAPWWKLSLGNFLLSLTCPWTFQMWAFFRTIFNIRAKITTLKPLLFF